MSKHVEILSLSYSTARTEHCFRKVLQVRLYSSSVGLNTIKLKKARRGAMMGGHQKYVCNTKLTYNIPWREKEISKDNNKKEKHIS